MIKTIKQLQRLVVDNEEILGIEFGPRFLQARPKVQLTAKCALDKWLRAPETTQEAIWLADVQDIEAKCIEDYIRVTFTHQNIDYCSVIFLDDLRARLESVPFNICPERLNRMSAEQLWKTYFEEVPHV